VRQGVIGRDVETDTATTIASGATTTTVLVNSTSNILPVSPSSASSSVILISYSSMSSRLSPSVWSGSWPSTWPNSWSYTRNSISSSTSATRTSTNSTSTSSSAPSSTTAGPISTSCPYINGTTFNSGDPCQSYQYICRVGYPDEDFYDLEESYDSVEMCAADVCTHANSGEATPCLGVLWNAVDGNCRELKSLDNPFYDQFSVGALSVRSNVPSCQKNISVTSSSMPSTSSPPYSMNVTTSATSNMPMSRNISTTWPMNTTTTWNYPTGTGWPHHNHTHSHNGTRPIHNSTWSRWLTTGYSSGTAILSGSPIPTNNNTCPITTAVSTLTKYATLYSGNYTSTTTETQYINALPNNASTVTQVSLVTVVITDPFTTTTDSTTTVTEYLTNTETETTIFTTTAGGNPVGGRFGRTWWMF
jgi:hypothetical protein